MHRIVTNTLAPRSPDANRGSHVDPSPDSKVADHNLRWFGWLGTGVPISLAIGWIAFQLQQEGVAPAILFPLLVGAAVGGGLVMMARTLSVTLRKSAMFTALVRGLATVAGQEWFAYVRYCRVYEESVRDNPRAALAAAAAPEWGPARFGDFVRARVERDQVWWLADAGLTVIGSVGAMMVAGAANRGHRNSALSAITNNVSTKSSS